MEDMLFSLGPILYIWDILWFNKRLQPYNFDLKLSLTELVYIKRTRARLYISSYIYEYIIIIYIELVLNIPYCTEG